MIRRTLVAVSAIAAVTAVGCSSSTSSGSNVATSSSAASGGSTASTATGTPIKIGQIATESSANISLPEAQAGAQAAVAAVNAAGGVNGHPLQLTFCDDQGNAEQTGVCAQQLLKTDKVVALVGSSPGLGGGPIYPVLDAVNSINFGDFPNNAPDLTDPRSYPFGQSTGGLSLYGAAVPQGSGTVDYVTYAAYQSYVQQVVSPGFVKRGYKVNVVPIDPTSADFSAAAQQVARDKPKYVMIGVSQDKVAAIVSSLVQGGALTGATLLISSNALNSAAIKAIQSTGATPHIIVMDYARDPKQFPMYQQYLNEIQKYGSSAAKADIVGSEELNAWVAVHAFAEVAKKLPDVTGAALKAYMDKQTAFQTGLNAPLDFTKAGPIEGIPRMVNYWIRSGSIDYSNDTVVDSGGPFVDASTLYS